MIYSNDEIDSEVKDWCKPDERQVGRYEKNRIAHITALLEREHLLKTDPVIADLLRSVESNQDNVLKLNIMFKMIDSPEGFEPMESRQIGDLLGVSGSNVRHAKMKALRKIKEGYEEFTEIELNGGDQTHGKN